MASNSFGTLFKMTTWGESHGKAIGVVVDGCPAGLELRREEIQQALLLRSPGKSPYTSPRQEKDFVEILSGVFDGKTTGAPISLLIPNEEVDSSKYDPIQDMLRPGHSNYTYLEKYGIFDYRGGGRSSGRETACRVAAGAIAKKLLSFYQIDVVAYLQQVYSVQAKVDLTLFTASSLRNAAQGSQIFCPDPQVEPLMVQCIEEAKTEGDSLGGVVGFASFSLPPGLGDPIYEKLESKLASALMSIPASKGFEIGSGFQAASMKGSFHNDLFIKQGGHIETQTNHAGGVLGGISTGMTLFGRVAFKPPSSIFLPQKTLSISSQEEKTLSLPPGSRHDPCLAIRAVPVVEAMVCLVLADALLLHRGARR